MRTRALSLIAVGIVLVALDFRVVALDVLPDAVGWVLVAAGAWKLALSRPAMLAVVAALAAAPDVIARHHLEALDPLTGDVVMSPAPGTKYDERLVFDRLTDSRLLLAVVAIAAGGFALWSLLGTLSRRAHLTGDDTSSVRLRVLRWLILALWVAPYLLVATLQSDLDGGFDPVWNGGLELVALVGLAVLAAVAWVLIINSNRSWTATDAARATPWAKMTPERS
jgi:hypothetical protein